MKNLKPRRPSATNRDNGRHYSIFKDCRISVCRFHSGEVYLFNRYDRRCPSKSSLWGIFDKQINADIYLESSSGDLRKFELWHKLSADYKYCRLATRAEVRDFMYDLAWYEKNGRI